MDANEKIFVIEDQTILDFYRENPNLDIVDVNRIFIDLLKKIAPNLNETQRNLQTNCPKLKKEY